MKNLTLDWTKYMEAAIECAAEGIVMLKNDNALPLEDGCRVALFGRMQNHYYKSGTGSGGMVNVDHVDTIREALGKCDKITLNKKLCDVYDKWDSENEVDPGLGWGKERWSQDEMPPDEDLVKEVAANSDCAVIVIARTAGEDRDNSAEAGSYYLTAEEKNMLATVTSVFDRTVVLLNTGNIIDMNFVDEFNPSAVLYIWQAGLAGGAACVQILTGEKSPSGCLTDTIAKDLEDYPSYANFGKDGLTDYYKEDIFVGYRYFSTFAKDRVMYPFGYGLSYTTFEFENASVTQNRDSVRVSADVKNTGDFAGKKVVTVFVCPPAGKLSKPSRVLAGFAKTGQLAPGESETVEIDIPVKYIASFDDDGRAGLGTGWVIEKGSYEFFVGGDVNSAESIGCIEKSESYLLETVDPVLAPIEEFERLTNNGYEKVPMAGRDVFGLRAEENLAELPQTGDRGIKLSDVKNGSASMDDFVSQLNDEDLSLLVLGEGMGSLKVTMGTAGAFAGLTAKLKDLDVPAVCCSDGPSGMRIDSGKKAFSLPNGTCLASTFNTDAVGRLFEFLGIEMVSNKIDTLLGPGMNIHRFPLNGRNFEYFSEDPLLSGKMASAQVRAFEKCGVTPTVKHFAANNRETDRRLMNSVVSEKALREIYLRGFEIAVREGGVRSIMSSYNRINGTFASSNLALNTFVLRKQWGYKGIVMTDWWASIGQDGLATEKDNFTQFSVMARAQNDLYMVVSNVTPEAASENDCYRELSSGDGTHVTRAELQRCAANILRFAMDTPAMDRICGEEIKVTHVNKIFGGEDEAASADVYFNIDEEDTFELDGATLTGNDCVFGIVSDRDGQYNVTVTGVSDLGQLAQIPMTVFVTSIPIAVMTWNGTGGQEDTRSIKFYMYTRNSRTCVVRVHPQAPGVKLLKIKFDYEGPIPDGVF